MIHMSFHVRLALASALAFALGVSAVGERERAEEADLSEEEEGKEKPKLLQVVEAERVGPKHGIELRVLQRHGRAPLPPDAGHMPTTNDEMSAEFDEVIVEWRTNLFVSSILLRLPERQQQLPSETSFDGYKFFTGPNSECKFQLGDKHVLPDNDEIRARDVAGGGDISSCVADNSDPSEEPAPKRGAALLKLHPHPFGHNESGWRYFSMMIRNPQKAPIRNDVYGTLANTFQLVMNTTSGETVAAMSFQALDIEGIWVCSYTEWVPTTPCSAECGGGFRTKVRRRLHAPPPNHNPKLLKNCDEPEELNQNCNTKECDIDCQLSDWTAWASGECSRSCGNGTMVERRNVIMGPKGYGKICPPWHEDKVRVRTKPCNTFPCEASCKESPLAEKYRDLAKEGMIKLHEDKPKSKPKDELVDLNGTNETIEEEEEEMNTTSLEKVNNTNANAATNEEDSNRPGSMRNIASIGNASEQSEESLLSTGSSFKTEFLAMETPRAEAAAKVASDGEEKNCPLAFEEDCNMFPCQPLMLQPATPWQYPVVGKWFLVDIEFVIEELAESLTIRAPPDFLLAATGESSECFLVEHSMPNLENCTVYPGQTGLKTGPIMVLNFSNPLEPQNSYTWKRAAFIQSGGAVGEGVRCGVGS
ncbi:unnamed protein product [Effrenium voratum]|nr:unnamed protein product [Effrenium voratum]